MLSSKQSLLLLLNSLTPLLYFSKFMKDVLIDYKQLSRKIYTTATHAKNNWCRILMLTIVTVIIDLKHLPA
jgi:hypothetical protein